MPLLNLSLSQLFWVCIAAHFLIKARRHRLFLRWLASGGLTCFKMPTDEELRPLKHRAGAGDAKRDHQTKKGNKQRGAKSGDRSASNSQSAADNGVRGNEFKIKSSDLTKLNLKQVQINSRVLLAAPYGDDLESVTDFAFMSLISFTLTQSLFYFNPAAQEYNLSLIWILAVLKQCLSLLYQLTSVYFKNRVSIGERSLCILSGCFFLLVAMIVLALDGTHLELRVNESLALLSNGTAFSGAQQPPPPPPPPNKDALLDPDQIDTPPLPPPPILKAHQAIRPASLILVKLLIAVICSLVAVVFTFPGLRYGKLHENLMANEKTGKMQKLFYNLNYVSPVIVICLWQPSISRDLARRFSLITDERQYELFRISTILAAGVLRLIVVKRYVQTFLASSASRIDAIRFRGGLTTNREVQVTIASMNNYVNVACMQYILPILVCSFTTIAYATLRQCASHDPDPAPSKQLAILRYLFGDNQQALVERAEESMHQMRLLVSSGFIANMFGFAAWWFHFAWSCTSTIGIVYHKYLTH